MALMLRSRGILAAAKRLGSCKRRDSKTVPLVALGAGAALNLVGMNALGDGAMAAGATILGYKMGAKGAQQRQLEAATSRPSHPAHAARPPPPPTPPPFARGQPRPSPHNPSHCQSRWTSQASRLFPRLFLRASRR